MSNFHECVTCEAVAIEPYNWIFGAGYCSDENFDLPRRNVSMAAFRDVVKDSLEKIDNMVPAKVNTTSRPGSKLFPCNQADVDQHSGLRIRLIYFVTVLPCDVCFSYAYRFCQFSTRFLNARRNYLLICWWVHGKTVYRDRLVSATTLTSKLCDLKFVRLQGIK